jgi:uncharacterized DUF497 family protein
VRLYEIIWKDQFVEKIERKHQVTMDEVEQVLFVKPHIRRIETGKIKGESLYAAYGKTRTGRYILVFFILKQEKAALPISARDMTSAERKYYDRQKES